MRDLDKVLDNTGDTCYCIVSEAIAQTQAKRGHGTTKKTARRTKRKSSSYDVLSPNQTAIAIREPSSDKSSFADSLNVSWLYNETRRYLERLARAVHDGRAIDEASNFARWLQFSGLLKSFDGFKGEGPLPADGKVIRIMTEDLIAACGEIYKGGKRPVNPSESRIDELNNKVDVILSHIAKNIARDPSCGGLKHVVTSDPVDSEVHLVRPAAYLQNLGQQNFRGTGVGGTELCD